MKLPEFIKVRKYTVILISNLSYVNFWKAQEDRCVKIFYLTYGPYDMDHVVWSFASFSMFHSICSSKMRNGSSLESNGLIETVERFDWVLRFPKVRSKCWYYFTSNKDIFKVIILSTQVELKLNIISYYKSRKFVFYMLNIVFCHKTFIRNFV